MIYDLFLMLYGIIIALDAPTIDTINAYILIKILIFDKTVIKDNDFTIRKIIWTKLHYFKEVFICVQQ